MSTPMWLDTNILADILNGDAKLEAELIALQKAGYRFYLTPGANNELLYGNPITMSTKANAYKQVAQQQPSPGTRAQLEQLKKRFNVDVDTSAGALTPDQRMDNAMLKHVKIPKNQATPNQLSSISESDLVVMGEVRSAAQARGITNPIFMSKDAGVRANGHLYGLDVRTPEVAEVKPKIPSPTPSAEPPPVKHTPTETPTPPTTNSTSEPKLSEIGSSSPTSRLGVLPKAPSFKARVAAGAKFVGGTVVSTALQFLAVWLRAKLDEALIQAKIKTLGPAIEREIHKRSDDIAFLQVNGDKAYANVTLTIRKFFAGGVPTINPPLVFVSEIGISSRPINVVGETPPPPPNWTLPWMQTTTHTYAIEVRIFSDDDLKTLASLTDIYQIYSRELKRSPASAALSTQLRIVREAIIEGFGTKVWVLAN